MLRSGLAETIKTARHMAVVHNAILFDGTDWKVWRIERSGLTYGQLDTFIDMCTEAIDTLAHLALRQSHAFELEPFHAKTWAGDYVEALVIGLENQARVRAP